MVYGSFSVTFPSTANATEVNIGGFPFTPANTGFSSFGGVATRTNYTGGVITYVVSTTTAEMIFYKNGDTGSPITNANMSTLNVRGTFMYQAA
jgi:hypothetical protein